jgi:hypothetical protein
MSLTPRERFEMLRQLGSHVQDDARWPYQTLSILVQQFSLGELDPDQWESAQNAFVRLAGRTDDDSLLALYATVLDIPEDDARATLSVPDDHGLWHEGHVRVFLSHTARQKAFLGDVSSELAVVGVHGFVAHETMQIEKPWQRQIEIALRTCEAFVAIVHPEVLDSAWCHQEIGWASGRGVPMFFIRMGADPPGFPGETQWPSMAGGSAKEVAQEITSWLERSTDFTNRIVDGLVQALAEASDYYSAEAAAKRIEALGALSETSWEKLNAAYHANDQVYGGLLPTRVLKPFYERNDRPWPPQEPVSNKLLPAEDPWGTPSVSRD